MNDLNSQNPLEIQKKHLVDAVNTIKQLIGLKNSPENLLSSRNSQYITLLVGLSKTPEFIKSKHVLIKISNSLYKYPQNEVCLFVKDPQRKWKDVLNNNLIEPNIVTKVIGVSKLSKKYATFKDRRELCSGYDLFLADDRIIEKMPKLLGSFFIKTNKMPIAIKIRESNFKNTIETAVSSTFMSIRKGRCIGIRVARTDMNTEQIVQNIKDVIFQVFNFFTNEQKDKSWHNDIESLHIQSTNTISLPIWFKNKVD